MILKAGNKLLLVHRRLFHDDRVRYFLGEVVEYENGMVLLSGHSFVRNDYNGDLISKEGAMKKIFSIASGTLITYVLPVEINFSDLKFGHNETGEVWLAGADGFRLNLTEHYTGTTHS